MQALETAVRQNPDLVEAHRKLAHIYRRSLLDEARALEHERAAGSAEERVRRRRKDRLVESKSASRVAEFLGGGLDVEAIAQAVDPGLCRSGRATGSTSGTTP